MKKLFSITALCLFLSFQLFSQVIVEGVNINELENVTVCQIIATGRLFSSKITIDIDYGQKTKFGKKGSSVKGQNGKSRKFNSTIEAINYMESNGWIYIDALSITVDSGLGGKQNVYHYYFRKSE